MMPGLLPLERMVSGDIPFPLSLCMQIRGEVGLSSPAVVNDVVFVTTNAAALYAFDVANGHCL
jgi:glucose dehydrogenase